MNLNESRVIGPQGLVYRAIPLVDFMCAGVFVAPPNDEIRRIHEAQPNLFLGQQPGDWLLIPVDGGRSYIVSPQALKMFDQDYGSSVVDLDKGDFSQALHWLKEGKRVARAGWNGKGQWVVILHGGSATLRDVQGVFTLHNCFGLKTAQGDMQPGWTPSTGDLMADDWKVVE